jgi:hypothetical protein
MSTKVLSREKISVVKKEVIECSCGAHVLQITSDTMKQENSPVIQEFYFAMFHYGEYTSRNKSFWHRLKWAWQYLRKGTVYSDQLCLSPEEAKRMASFIFDNDYSQEKTHLDTAEFKSPGVFTRERD